MNTEAFNNLTKAQQLYVESIREIGGNQLGYDLTKSNWTRVGRGVYSVPEVVTDVSPGHGVEGDNLSDMHIADDMDDTIQVSDDQLGADMLVITDIQEDIHETV